MHDSFKTLLPLIIPEGVSGYFQMTHYSKDAGRLDIFLEEINTIPEEYQGSTLTYKGFLNRSPFMTFRFAGSKYTFM